MKNSAVKWIGAIPDSWKILQLKYVSDHITKKRAPKNGEFRISPENVVAGSGKIINRYSDHGKTGVEFLVGDTLFNKIGTNLSKVAFCDFPGLSMGEMIVLRPTGYEPKFQYYLLSSSLFIDQINSFVKGVTLPRPPVHKIMGTKVPVPPSQEQKLMVKYLDKKISQINFLIDRQITTFLNQKIAVFQEVIKKEIRQVNLLSEYRQSLISHVVTGKVRITKNKL